MPGSHSMTSCRLRSHVRTCSCKRASNGVTLSHAIAAVRSIRARWRRRDATNVGDGTLSNQPLAGKTALVTGASRNIGRAIALKLAAAGADIVVNTLRDRDAAEAVAGEIA